MYSEFTEDKILPPPKQPFATDDPLAEFYDQARAELRAEVKYCRHISQTVLTFFA